MNSVLKIVSRVGLVLTAIPPFLYLSGVLEIENLKTIMALGMLFWFATAPVLQNHNKAFAHHEDQDNI